MGGSGKPLILSTQALYRAAIGIGHGMVLVKKILWQQPQRSRTLRPIIIRCPEIRILF